MPVGAQAFKLATELILIVLMTGLNFRGMRESIMVLLPIFMGFVVLHLGLIVYGVAVHGNHLAAVCRAPWVKRIACRMRWDRWWSRRC